MNKSIQFEKVGVPVSNWTPIWLSLWFTDRWCSSECRSLSEHWRIIQCFHRPAVTVQHQSGEKRCRWSRCVSAVTDENSVISLLELGIPTYNHPPTLTVIGLVKIILTFSFCCWHHSVCFSCYHHSVCFSCCHHSVCFSCYYHSVCFSCCHHICCRN